MDKRGVMWIKYLRKITPAIHSRGRRKLAVSDVFFYEGKF